VVLEVRTLADLVVAHWVIMLLKVEELSIKVMQGLTLEEHLLVAEAEALEENLLLPVIVLAMAVQE
jgi:hypothetical protein